MDFITSCFRFLQEVVRYEWGRGWCVSALWNLINVVQLEVLEEQQQQSRDGLDDDLLVAVDVDPQLHALKDCDPGGHTNTRTCCEPFSCLIVTGLITLTHQGDQDIAGNRIQTAAVFPTYGISSGSTSARMLMESVLALEVGAAASSSFRRAI